jgi:3-hydroxyisobutyrate dehydrogenase-like beta-hydroxyacid dehydrogenase
VEPSSSPLAAPVAIAIAGLGAMGGAMARHLVAAGYQVSGYDPDLTAMSAAARAGVRPAAGVGELSESSGVLITSLPSDASLDAVARELRASPGQLVDVIETSTLAVEQKQRTRDVLGPVGIDVLDCPISGTSAQLASRDAIVYASGSPDGLRRCQPVLEAFSRQVLEVGPFGAGSRLKLVANLLVAVHNVAAAEAIAVAAACGLSPSLVLSALTSGAGSSRMLEVRGPMMVERRYRPAAMRLRLFDKDLKLIESLASQCGVSTPVFTASTAVYAAAERAGYGDEDTASVLEVLLATEPGPG